MEMIIRGIARTAVTRSLPFQAAMISGLSLYNQGIKSPPREAVADRTTRIKDNRSEALKNDGFIVQMIINSASISTTSFLHLCLRLRLVQHKYIETAGFYETPDFIL